MLFKAFQIFLVTFLVVFTAAGAVLLLYGVLSVIALNTSGGIAFVGGFSLSAVRMIIVIALLLIVAGVSLIARRHRLR
jgi:hypothetical protein